jgi:hypothetical protein
MFKCAKAYLGRGFVWAKPKDSLGQQFNKTQNMST